MNERNRRIITILSIFTIIFTVMGGSLAYWNWSSTTRTGVAFTIDKDFSCSADGGGNIAPTNISLEPSTCTNPNTTIKRKIVVTPDIKKSGLEISLDMWLNINSIGTPLSNSANLKYVLTTSGSSCEAGTIISKGNFSSKTTGDRVMLLEKNYTADASETYYLYIWLDKEETSMDTMNQSFDFSLGGNCSNYVGEPEAPVLDPAMIPVTIANDGKVTTVSKDDPNWYDYSNKQWANIVLVNEEATEGVTDSHPRSYYQNNIGEEVTEDDILAYYVWIPRYKYKIPTNSLCSDLENPTPENNPECYKNTYTILNTSIAESEIKSWMENNGNVWPCSCSYDLTEEGSPYGIDCSAAATKALNDFLDDGQAYIDCDGITSIDKVLTEGVHYQVRYGLNPNNFVVGAPTSIDITFESKDEDMILGNATTQYRTHPAFWWDNDSDNIVDNGEMLSGFWMPKFEPSSNNSVEQCAHGEDIDGDGLLDGEDIVGEGNLEDYECFFMTSTPIVNYVPLNSSISETIIKDDLSWNGITSSNFFTFPFDKSKTNKHLIKNSEWGALAYLSHSNYGINQEIRINNTKITGCGASSSNASTANNIDDLTSCSIKYGSGVSSYPQSTTGNISGVFDMSGGRREPVDLNFEVLTNNAHDQDFSTTIVISGVSCNGNLCFGHAIEETANWYNNLNTTNVEIFDTDYSNLYRGANYDSQNKAGIFAYNFEDGTTYGADRWIISRETIVVR